MYLASRGGEAPRAWSGAPSRRGARALRITTRPLRRIISIEEDPLPQLLGGSFAATEQMLKERSPGWIDKVTCPTF